jgi:hypothetical protein
MAWGKDKGKKLKTVDLRKKQSFLDTLRKKKTHNEEDEVKCKNCYKKIIDKPIFCNKYLSRTRFCNAGPFCSELCLNEHLENTSHY